MRVRVAFTCLGLVLALGVASAQNFPIAPYKTEASVKRNQTQKQEKLSAFSSIQDFAKGLFLRTDVDKVNLYENELVQVKWVLYYPNIPKLDVEYQITNYQIPNLPDFVKEWNIIVKDGDSTSVRGVIENGQPYRARTLLCFYMYPSKGGKAVIDSGALTIQLYSDGKEFGGPVVLKSNPVALSVKALPAAPDNFTGGIGDYSLDTELLQADSVRVGSTATFRVRVKGSGNFKFVSAPKLVLPDSVECYSVKPVNDIHYDCNKCSGGRVFDFVFIPHMEEDFVIPSTTISYFDSRTRRFKELKSQACKVSVLPALPKKEFVQSEVALQPEKRDSFVTWIYVCAGLLGILIVLFALALCHKKSLKNPKVNFELKAYDALNEAKTSLEGSAFYNKTVSILIDYIGDKLNYPVATQSKAVLTEILRENGASDAAVSLVITVISECEKACYSPQTDTKQDTIIETTFFAITQLQKDFDNTVRCNTIS